MFTGLVRATGLIERAGGGVRLRWQAAPEQWHPGLLELGESVAVDGVCLTVAARLSDGFRADVSEETLARSTLAGKADRRGAVNLEPALRLADRLGGHLVSGHVDGLGRVQAVEARPGSWHLAIRWQDPAYGRYVCDKASVAVDGVSLTVAGCAAGGAHFWIAVIPHTWSGTTLQGLKPGDTVNLEADLLAKYAESLLHARLAGPAPGGPAAEATAAGGRPDLDRAWLAEHGWSA